MVDNGELAIGLLDLELSRSGLDVQDVIVSGIDHHGGGRRSRKRWDFGVGYKLVVVELRRWMKAAGAFT